MNELKIKNIRGYDRGKNETKGVILKTDEGLYYIVWINRIGLPEFYVDEKYHKSIVGIIKPSFGKKDVFEIEKQILRKTIDVIYA